MTHEPRSTAVAGKPAGTDTAPVFSKAREPHPAAAQVPASLVPETGWHLLHLFYQIDRNRLSTLTAQERSAGRRQLSSILSARNPGKIEQLQTFAIPGHKADFGVMLAGPDLKAVHAVQTAIADSPLGPALPVAYSFYSITEVSEYVPDAEEYGRILRDREHVDPETGVYKAKVKAYAERLETMNRQRLQPDFPDWPCLCFYPMSKMRTAATRTGIFCRSRSDRS